MHKDKSDEIFEKIQTEKLNKRKEKLNNSGGQAKKQRRQDVDQLITDFVVDALVPYSVVDTPSFKVLVNAGWPNRSHLDRHQVADNVASDFVKLKTSLVETFNPIKNICITADCWSMYHR